MLLDLWASIVQAVLSAGGSGDPAKDGSGKENKRNRVLKKTIYGTVISVWQEEHHERPPVVVAEEITERVAETYRDIEAEIAEVEMRTLIVRLMAQAVEEEDDESAFFAMM